MFTTYTYQDYLAAEDKIALLCKAIEKFKASAEFVRALSASSYFRGENPTIARKTILRARKIETRGTDGRRHVRAGTEDVVGNRIGSSFLFRFVTQQNQFLLSEGVSLPEETKNVSARISTTFSPAWANAPCCTGSATATGTPTIWKSSRWRGRQAADFSPCWTK